MVNPKETPVYTRDAWTAVFPIHTVDTAKKRVGALEDIKNTLNKAGLKEDIMVKVLLSEDAYEKAYKPTVEALMQKWQRAGSSQRFRSDLCTYDRQPG